MTRSSVATFAGPDIVVSILEDTFTRAERSLVAMGESQRLRDARIFFQHSSEDAFRSIIERLLDRKVHAFVSGVISPRWVLNFSPNRCIGAKRHCIGDLKSTRPVRGRFADSNR